MRHTGGAFVSKSAARAHYRDVIEPGLNGRPVARRDLTYSDLVEVFLERHAIVAKPRTITELRWRLKQSEAKFGTVPLVELEGMTDEIAGFAVTISERLRHPFMAAFRQALEAGVRYGYLTRNPAKLAGPNPMPAPRENPGVHHERARRDHRGTGNRRGSRGAVRGGDRAQALGVGVRGAPRRRQDATGAAGARHQDRPVTTRGAADQGGARRDRAGAARLDSRYVFTTSRKCLRTGEPGPFDVANFRRRLWGPAIDAAGIAKPARLYDLRSTFISNALASGLTVFETARVAGTSVRMIEAHYGALLDSAHESLLERLEEVR